IPPEVYFLPVMAHVPASLREGPAFAFRLVDAERIEFAVLMQETLLRRHADQHFRRGYENRLAELAVPVAQRQPDALEGSQVECRRFNVCGEVFELAGFGARGGLADHAHGHPG